MTRGVPPGFTLCKILANSLDVKNYDVTNISQDAGNELTLWYDSDS